MRGEGLQWVKERALGGINSNCYPERRSMFQSQGQASRRKSLSICWRRKKIFLVSKKKFAEGIMRLQYEEVTDPRHLYHIQRNNVLKQQGEPRRWRQEELKRKEKVAPVTEPSPRSRGQEMKCERLWGPCNGGHHCWGDAVSSERSHRETTVLGMWLGAYKDTEKVLYL